MNDINKTQKATYSKSFSADIKSIGLVNYLCPEQVVPNLESCNTWPNIDGELILLDKKRHEFGRLKAQVKTLPGNHKFKFRCPIKFIDHCKDSGWQVPIILLGVDQKQKRVYWLYFDERFISSLDYGQKAFLVAEGVKRGEETNLVEEFMETGKSLEEILDSRVFQAELKSLREDIKAKEATPSNSKRSTSTSRDKVEYWVNKGELPPIDQVELRRAVVDAKVKSETSGSNFTGNPTGTIIVR